MGIHTAGEQKYYGFIEERVKQLRTGMIVWGSLLAVAFIGMFSDARLAVILAVIGVALAIRNVRSLQALKGKLDVVGDKEEFFRQLTDTDLIEQKDVRLMVAKDYLLVMKKDVFIYPFSDMEKVETKVRGKSGKTLFFTDRQGTQHEILSCGKGDKEKEEFERACRILNERV